MFENLKFVSKFYFFEVMPTDPNEEFSELVETLSSIPSEVNEEELGCNNSPCTDESDLGLREEVAESSNVISSVNQSGNYNSISSPETFAADFDSLRDMLANHMPFETMPSGLPVEPSPATSIGYTSGRTIESVKPTGNLNSVSDSKPFAGFEPAEPPVVDTPNVAIDMYNRIHFDGAVAAPGEITVGSTGVSSIGSSGLETECVKPSGNMSSVSSGQEFAATFGTPWYKDSKKLKNSVTGKNFPYTGQQLYAAEVELMKKRFPNAKICVLPNGELYWLLTVLIDTGHVTKQYTFMLKYDNNHPHASSWGGSCKAIFLKPSIEEMNARLKAKKGSSFSAPHILNLPGNEGEKYLCAISKDEQANMMRTGDVQGAAAVASRVIRYLYMFEIGLEDEAVWAEICRG